MMLKPRSEQEAKEWRDRAIRREFRNKWRVVLTADEIYRQRDAAKGKANA